MPVITKAKTDEQKAAEHAAAVKRWQARNPGQTFDPTKSITANSMISTDVRRAQGEFIYNPVGAPYNTQYNAWAKKNGLPGLGTTSPGVGGETYVKDGVLYGGDHKPIEIWGPDGDPDGVKNLPPDVADEFNPYGPDNPAPPFVGPLPDWYKPFEPTDPDDDEGTPPPFDMSPPDDSPWIGPAIPGVPGNPMAGPEGGDFSPFGKPIGKLSDSKVYGGLPRSTGPFGVVGGYYGGNPYTGQGNPLQTAQAAAMRTG